MQKNDGFTTENV